MQVFFDQPHSEVLVPRRGWIRMRCYTGKYHSALFFCVCQQVTVCKERWSGPSPLETVEAEHRGSVNMLLQTALMFLLQSLSQLITADLPLVAFTEPNCPVKHFHPPLAEVLWSALAVPLLPLTWRRLQPAEPKASSSTETRCVWAAGGRFMYNTLQLQLQ